MCHQNRKKRELQLKFNNAMNKNITRKLLRNKVVASRRSYKKLD